MKTLWLIKYHFLIAIIGSFFIYYQICCSDKQLKSPNKTFQAPPFKFCPFGSLKAPDAKVRQSLMQSQFAALLINHSENKLNQAFYQKLQSFCFHFKCLKQQNSLLTESIEKAQKEKQQDADSIEKMKKEKQQEIKRAHEIIEQVKRAHEIILNAEIDPVIAFIRDDFGSKIRMGNQLKGLNSISNAAKKALGGYCKKSHMPLYKDGKLLEIEQARKLPLFVSCNDLFGYDKKQKKMIKDGKVLTEDEIKDLLKKNKVTTLNDFLNLF